MPYSGLSGVLSQSTSTECLVMLEGVAGGVVDNHTIIASTLDTLLILGKWWVEAY